MMFPKCATSLTILLLIAMASPACAVGPITQTQGLTSTAPVTGTVTFTTSLPAKFVETLNLRTVPTMVVTSPAFKEGEFIPKDYTCQGRNISPALSWTGVPSGTQSLVLIFEDPDAPLGTWVHWVMFNIPPTATGLPEAVPPTPTRTSDGQVQSITSFGKPGYGGPCPPMGTHRYFFNLLALDTMLTLTETASRDDVLKASVGHVVGFGELMGRYQKS